MASKNFSSNLKIGATMSPSVGRVFGGVNSKIKTQEATLKKLHASYKLAAKGTGEYAGKLDQLKGKIAAAEKELKRLNTTAKFNLGGALKNAGASIGHGMKRLSLAAGAGVIAGGAGALNITKDFIDYADDIGDTAEALGMSTQALQTWQFAASEVGVDANQTAASIAKFNKIVADGGADETLKELGINAERFKKSSLDDQLLAVAEAFKDYKGSGNLAAMMMTLFGRVGYKLTGVVSKGAKGMQEFRKQGEKTGAVLDKDMVDKADDAAKSFSRLGMSYRGLKNRMGARLGPAVGSLADMLTKKIEEKSPNFERWADDAASYLEHQVTPALKEVMEGAWFGEVGESLKSLWDEADRSSAAWFQDVGSSIAILVGDILSSAWSKVISWFSDAGSSIAVILNKGLDDSAAYLGKVIGRNVEALLSMTGEVVGKIKDSFTSLFNWFDTKLTSIGSTFSGIWDKVKGVGDFFGGSSKDSSFNAPSDLPSSRLKPASIVPLDLMSPTMERSISQNNGNTYHFNINVPPGANGVEMGKALRREIQRKPLFDPDGSLLPA